MANSAARCDEFWHDGALSSRHTDVEFVSGFAVCPECRLDHGRTAPVESGPLHCKARLGRRPSTYATGTCGHLITFVPLRIPEPASVNNSGRELPFEVSIFSQHSTIITPAWFLLNQTLIGPDRASLHRRGSHEREADTDGPRSLAKSLSDFHDPAFMDSGHAEELAGLCAHFSYRLARGPLLSPLVVSGPVVDRCCVVFISYDIHVIVFFLPPFTCDVFLVGFVCHG